MKKLRSRSTGGEPGVPARLPRALVAVIAIASVGCVGPPPSATSPVDAAPPSEDSATAPGDAPPTDAAALLDAAVVDACPATCAWHCLDDVCDDPVAIVAGQGLTCALRASGRVMCWGRNSHGELGDGSTDDSVGVPVQVAGLSDAVEIDVGAYPAGGSHACARRASGAVVCWGGNLHGQLGDGTSTGRVTPTAVVGLDDAVEIALGGGYSCARRASGAVVCWGYNFRGQLGDGTMTGHRVPEPVVGIGDAVSLATGLNHACARRASGEVVCWGANSVGQLGTGLSGASTDRTTPGLVVGVTTAVEISAGDEHSCARLTGGSVVCWGLNDSRQLGNGVAIFSSDVPVSVVGVDDAIGVAAGIAANHGHTCALRSSGHVACWGANSRGQLGDGTRMDRATGVEVSGLSDVLEIAAGAGHTCALRTGGAVACWGATGFGVATDGTNDDDLVPVDVAPP